MVTIRLTQAEHDDLTAARNRSGLSFSDIFRALGTGKTIEEKPPKIHAETLYELGKIGNNLNQIAKKLHETGQLLPDSFDEIVEKLREISQKVR